VGTTIITVTATDDNSPTAGVTTRNLTVTVTPSPISTFANTAPITIRDTNTASVYPSTINVSGLIGSINTVSVVLDGLTHPRPDDIDVLLVSPAGQKIRLMSDAGGTTPVSGARLTFTATGAALPDEGPITTGTYSPSNYRGAEGDADPFAAPAPAAPYGSSFADFVGTAPNGNWDLYIVDDTTPDGGSISFGWALAISTRPVIDLDETTLSNGTYEEWAEDGAGVIEFTLDDQVTPEIDLEIRLSSSRPEVLPVDNIRLDRSLAGGTRVRATLRSAPNAFGTNNLTITVVRPSDGAASSIIVPMNVTPVADLPTIGDVGNVSTAEDTAISVEAFVEDPDSARSQLRLVATSSDQSIIPNSRIAITGSDNDVTGLGNNPVRISILPATNAVGFADITLTAFDESGGSSSPEVFRVTVTAVNDAPVLTLTPPTSIEAGTTVVTPFTITDVEGQSIPFTTSSSDTNLIRNEDIVVAPASGTQTSRTLTITARSNVVGTARINLAYGDGTATNIFSFNVNVRLPRERTFSNNTPIDIRDNNSASPYPSTINVSGFIGNISEITVMLNGFGHTFPDDVDVLLVSPHGERVILMSDAGSGTPVAGLDIKFDQAAASPIPDNSPLSSGSFSPGNYYTAADPFAAPAPAAPYSTTLATFNDVSPNGTWSLYIMDDFQGDSGRITNGWTLGVTTIPAITLATNVIDTTEDREVSTTFTIQEESFGGTNFTFSFTATNTTLFPDPSTNFVVANRGGGTYTLTIRPRENTSGTSLVTMNVTNEDGQVVPVQFRVNVEDKRRTSDCGNITEYHACAG